MTIVFRAEKQSCWESEKCSGQSEKTGKYIFVIHDRDFSMLLKTKNSYTECSLKTFCEQHFQLKQIRIVVYMTQLMTKHQCTQNTLTLLMLSTVLIIITPHFQTFETQVVFCLCLLSIQISWALLTPPSKCHIIIYSSFLIRSSLISHVLTSQLINTCFCCVYFCVLLLLFLSLLKYLNINKVPTDMPSN